MKKWGKNGLDGFEKKWKWNFFRSIDSLFNSEKIHFRLAAKNGIIFQNNFKAERVACCARVDAVCDHKFRQNRCLHI
jgi:hypothetical protein